MLKLFKYEMRKTLLPKLIMLGMILCLEGIFIYTLLSSKEDSATLLLILLMLASFVGVLFIGIQAIITLHRDMNTKQSYMLFMTPNSCYAILGAKALECLVSVVLASLAFFGICLLDCRWILARFDRLAQLQEFITDILSMVGKDLLPDLPTVAVYATNTVVSWIETVMLAFFADVLATALLKGKKFGGFLSFILFLVLSVIAGKLVSLIRPAGSGNASLLLRSVAMLAISAAVYAATANLMEKKLSV